MLTLNLQVELSGYCPFYFQKAGSSLDDLKAFAVDGKIIVCFEEEPFNAHDKSMILSSNQIPLNIH